MKKYLITLLVISLCFSTIPAAAAGNEVDLSSQIEVPEGNIEQFDQEYGLDVDSDTVIKGVAAVVVTGGVIYLGRRFYRRSRANNFYKQAQTHEENGDWGKAVESYEKALEIVSDYKDTDSRLATARQQAEEKFITLGDEAEEEEKYERAAEYYQMAKKYNPDSFRPQNRLDKLNENLVEVHYRRGHTFETQNEWEEAFAEYEEAYNVNPDYKDLEDRYHRAKAQVKGDIPLRAIVFLVNRTSQTGMEDPFVNELQDRMEGVITEDFYMMERDKVKDVMQEQGEALSDSRDQELAVDLGKILGADEVVTGEISKIGSRLGRVTLTIDLVISDVESGNISEEISYTHRFERGVEKSEIKDHLREAARGLVE
ncbi:MAG: tetratricopeptide repeat protein, partial [Halanaerobiales bacterium]